MAEFSVIERFCQSIGCTHPETKLSVGDDAAVLSIPESKDLVVSVDTMVEGVHFFSDTPASLLAVKLLAVNLSDLAAMGAVPKWATLALTLPNNNEAWLEEFSTALNEASKRHKVQLVGGDTTQGPLVLSLQIMGLVEKGAAITRAHAQPGDDIYVSGQLGDAALAVAFRQGKIELDDGHAKYFSSALDRPIPQLGLGQKLVGLATSCIDLSDGLLGDLQHIAKQSQVGLDVDVSAVPISEQYQHFCATGGNIDYALAGGDDYQLAFTAHPRHSNELSAIADQLEIMVTKIGQVVDSEQPIVRSFQNGEPYSVTNQSFQHFAEEAVN